MQIRIEGTDLPGRSCGPSPDVPGGYRNIHVGVQRRGRRDELLGLTPGDAAFAIWSMECQLGGAARPDGRAADVRGPYIQGPPGGRFIYLNWVTVDNAGQSSLFRRAKLWLDGVPPEVLDEAARTGLLVGRLGLTDSKGNRILRIQAGRPDRTVRRRAGAPGSRQDCPKGPGEVRGGKQSETCSVLWGYQCILSERVRAARMGSVERAD